VQYVATSLSQIESQASTQQYGSYEHTSFTQPSGSHPELSAPPDVQSEWPHLPVGGEVQHVLALHDSPVAHFFPHLPQLFGSVVVSMQALAQHVLPEHALPQAPQLLSSVVVSVQVEAPVRPSTVIVAPSAARLELLAELLRERLRAETVRVLVLHDLANEASLQILGCAARFDLVGEELTRRCRWPRGLGGWLSLSVAWFVVRGLRLRHIVETGRLGAATRPVTARARRVAPESIRDTPVSAADAAGLDLVHRWSVHRRCAKPS
jgi:hypothetical protein